MVGLSINYALVSVLKGRDCIRDSPVHMKQESPWESRRLRCRGEKQTSLQLQVSNATPSHLHPGVSEHTAS